MSLLRGIVIGCFILFSAGIACGQQSGVLIGLLLQKPQSEEAQSFDEIKEPEYQTIWVAPNTAGKLAVLATIPDVIVPMKDGFWHVGVKEVCEFSHEMVDQDGGNESIRQVVWREPIRTPGTVQVSKPCTEHDPSDYAPPYGRSEDEKNKISQCGYELREIEYVSPALLSVRKYEGQSEACEARGGRYTVDFSVIGYESDESLKVSQVLGDEARTAYLKALPKEGQGDGGESCGGEPSDQDTGWRIDRHGGRWAMFAHQDLGYFGCNVDAFVPFRLPSNVTGDNSPVPDWKQLKSAKDLRDAYLSPLKDLLIVMTGTELRFHEYAEGIPGKLLLTLPAHPIVMLQWSTGKHVQDWTQQLTGIVAHPLPEATVQVVQAGSPSN
jgi:hypothetical protein